MRKILFCAAAMAAFMAVATAAWATCGCGGGCCSQPYAAVAKVQVTTWTAYGSQWWPSTISATYGFNVYANNTTGPGGSGSSGPLDVGSYEVFICDDPFGTIEYHVTSTEVYTDPVTNANPCLNCTTWQYTGSKSYTFPTRGYTVPNGNTMWYKINELSDIAPPTGVNPYATGYLTAPGYP